MSDNKNFRQNALDYHQLPKPGKLEIRATKPLANQKDLALAYSPGVAEACEEIASNANNVINYTARGNLVGVITNGSAVLGLGNIGALASKPVMEGKAVLFKKFANIDVFDIEINCDDTQEFINIVKSLEPTFGAINLEDIGAPACFEIERQLDSQMNIPVFHDDQHGTAIVVAAAIKNALFLTKRDIADIKLVSTGAGAAGIACLDLLVEMGVKIENITLCDRMGVVYQGRDNVNDKKAKYAQQTDARTLDDVITDTDLFLGLSSAGILTKEMVKKMAVKPIIMALANPDPEILPSDVKSVRGDAIIATGRSDYPNQVNNVLCFPFIFRAALDVGAKTINNAMKLACAEALANLAREAASAEVTLAYDGKNLVFGEEYLIPKPFDPRLLVALAPAIAKAAMESNNATRPIDNLDDYEINLKNFVYRSGFFMKSVFAQAQETPRKIVFAEGEDQRILQVTQDIIVEKIGYPILIGRPKVIAQRIEKLGLAIDIEKDIEICNPESDKRYKDYWQTYYTLCQRQGISPDAARHIIRTNNTAIASVMVRRGEADTMICGTYSQYRSHLKQIERVFQADHDEALLASMSMIILNEGAVFISDPYVNEDPTAEELVQITKMAAGKVRAFGIEPQVALISNSNFGNLSTKRARKMSKVVALLDEEDVNFTYEGEMHVDVAVDHVIRNRIFPHSRLKEKANLFVFSNAETALVAAHMLRSVANGLPVGPILLGLDNRQQKSAHIVTPSITARGLLNMSAYAIATTKI